MGETSTKLTKRVVDSAAPREGRYFIWDSELKGFALRVASTGTKTYIVRYRPRGLGAKARKRFVVQELGSLICTFCPIRDPLNRTALSGNCWSFLGPYFRAELAVNDKTAAERGGWKGIRAATAQDKLNDCPRALSSHADKVDEHRADQGEQTSDTETAPSHSQPAFTTTRMSTPRPERP